MTIGDHYNKNNKTIYTAYCDLLERYDNEMKVFAGKYFGGYACGIFKRYGKIEKIEMVDAYNARFNIEYTSLKGSKKKISITIHTLRELHLFDTADELKEFESLDL